MVLMKVFIYLFFIFYMRSATLTKLFFSLKVDSQMMCQSLIRSIILENVSLFHGMLTHHLGIGL
jgi:hypothetical protein